MKLKYSYVLLSFDVLYKHTYTSKYLVNEGSKVKKEEQIVSYFQFIHFILNLHKYLRYVFGDGTEATEGYHKTSA